MVRSNREFGATKIGHIIIRHKWWVIAITVLFGAILLFLPDRADPLAKSSPGTEWTVVVVAGQSNAEGTNSLAANMPVGEKLGDHPADDQSYIWWRAADGAGPDDANEFFQVLTNPGFVTGGWINSQNPDPSLQGLVKIRDLDKPTPVGQKGLIGPEVGIVRQLYDQGRRNIIVLKVSYGFQALAKANSQFIPYDWYPDIPGQPPRNKSYTQLMQAYAQLKNFINSRGDTYKVSGIFWLQGETDAIDPTYAAAYKDNLDLLVNRLKTDLDLTPGGHVVVRKFNFRNCLDNTYPAVGNYCGFGYAIALEGASVSSILNFLTLNAVESIPLFASRVRTVRQAIQDIADKYDWVDTVETDDRPFGYDFIHLNERGQLDVGKRMVKMFQVP